MALSTLGQQSITSDTVRLIEWHAQRLQRLASLLNHRAFLLFECQNSNDSVVIRQWFDQLSEKQRTWLPFNNNTDRTDQIQQLLGTESNLVIYDATRGVDPRLLAAAAGSLHGGGLLLLLSPELKHWHTCYDNEYGVASSLFLKRLAEQFQHSCEQTALPRLWQLSLPSHESKTPITANNQFDEQDSLLSQLLEQLTHNACSVFVIQADRGRGKSTLLARIALSDVAGADGVAVTALHRPAVDVLQAYCAEQGIAINFAPLQAALHQDHKLLLVDEAATIPLPQLATLASRAIKIVFATTVDGYEGAGRGFATRFAKLLDEKHAGWQLVEPQNAIRWANGDRLEQLMNQALLLKSVLPEAPVLPIKTNDVQCSELSPAQLLADPTLLEQCFALLARAHYQTTAMDLRHMLDSPDITIWVARINNTPCAAALISQEGKLDDLLYQDIINKRRRVKHQLLAQLLTQFTLCKEILSPRYKRVVRIAVHPHVQGMGIGSALIGTIVKADQTSEAVGTSFGADQASLGFWIKQGFLPAHLGYKLNPRSGLPAVAMLLPKSEKLINAQHTAQAILQNNLQVLHTFSAEHSFVVDSYAALQNTLLKAHTDVPNNSNAQRTYAQQCQLYAIGSRNFLDSIAALHHYLNSHRFAQQPQALRLFHQLAAHTLQRSSLPNQRKLNRQLAGIIFDNLAVSGNNRL